MIAQEVLDEMARTDASVRARIADYSARIMALAEAYRILGKQFTFGSGGQLDARVNSLLVELSDACLEDAVYAARKGVAEDDEDSIIWAKANANAQETLDKYASHLKAVLEGWIAIGFANKLSGGAIITHLMAYMENPYITPLWRKAFEDGFNYGPQIIKDGGWHWGKGTPLSPLKGMSLTESYLINSAYQRGVIRGFSAKGAIGYRVHRGSTYDCPDCDAECVGIHPLTEMVIPVHPNCCCYATPVFAGEE